MNKQSFCGSTLLLALCGVAPACTSPVTEDPDDSQPLGDGSEAAVGPVHNTPSVPVVIDGVRYAPQDIHQFDGRPLYMIVDLADPDVLVAFTKQSDFQAAVDANRPRNSSVASPSATGQYVDYFSSDECTGDKLTVYSAWGINDLRGVGRGCTIWGCAGDWNDVISSVWVNGNQTLYTEIQYGGGTIWVGGWGCLNLSPYGFDNVSSSLNVWW
jgi:hypothetical protein